MSSAQHRYALVVPVKPVSVAKSRLAPLGEQVRRDLVVAFAVDTITAAREADRVGAVLAVTDDHVLAGALREVGAEVVPDATTDDLNGSLVQAAWEARRRWPELSVGALCADLPALKSAELDLALGLGQAHAQWYVADAAGDGTTLLGATSVEEFTPHFGAGSRQAHAAAGAVEVDHPRLTSLRRDVDTPGDLQAALALGLGVRSALVASGLRL